MVIATHAAVRGGEGAIFSLPPFFFLDHFQVLHALHPPLASCMATRKSMTLPKTKKKRKKKHGPYRKQAKLVCPRAKCYTAAEEAWQIWPRREVPGISSTVTFPSMEAWHRVFRGSPHHVALREPTATGINKRLGRSCSQASHNEPGALGPVPRSGTRRPSPKGKGRKACLEITQIMHALINYVQF